MDVVNFDALVAQGKIILASQVNLDKDYFIIGHEDHREIATNYPIYAIKAKDILNMASGAFANPFSFYLDAAAPNGGDGTAANPFNTLTDANNAVLAEASPMQAYEIFIAPSATAYGTEVTGTLTLAPNASLFGTLPATTGIACPVQLTASLGLPCVNQYRGLAFNGVFNIDLSGASFASVSVVDGAVNINRVDSNPIGFVLMRGGIGNSTLSGQVIMTTALIFGNVSVSPGATVYVNDSLSLGGKFLLNGNCTLKTLSFLNPSSGYVDGTVVAFNTPTWLTDASSDETYTGTVNKTVY